MKIKNVILALCTLLLTSCVVKSLHPFFTEETSFFDKRFIGEWTDNKGATWTIVSFYEEIFKSNSTKGFKNGKEYVVNTLPEKKTLKKFNKYKNSFYIKRKYNENEVIYLATPFKVGKQNFLDFLPLSHEGNIGDLLESHTIYTHSLVKYDIGKNGGIKIKWLDEEKIETLFKERKIKIQHKTFGLLNENYLLTASSIDLQKFIAKYIASNDAEKWETSTKFTLKKIDE